MAARFKSLKTLISKAKPADAYPWHIFKELEDSLNLIEDFDQIARNFLGKIKESLAVENLALLIYDQDHGKFGVSASMGGLPGVKNISFSNADPLVKWLKVNKTHLSLRGQPGVLDYLTPREKEMLGSLGTELCYPIISMNRLIGLLFVGAKARREPFSKQEISFLALLTPQTGIALENALLYREQRERFRRMLRADKLATIGELAAGAAHEIRNPLTAIKSSLQYLESKSQEETARKLLGTALEETGRIEEILSGLLSFSRPSDIKKERHDLLESLDESLDLIGFQARKQKVRIVKEFPPSALYISGDRSQLKQLFLNLLLNSLQAMPEGGELKLEVSPADGTNVLVTVTDTGEGIPEENLDRVFDPFFTTKKGGTGLGLSICYGIVRSHEGNIEVRSRPGRGTTVLTKFPLKD
jgi:two-component system, NtrC family, sensor kinase